MFGFPFLKYSEENKPVGCDTKPFRSNCHGQTPSRRGRTPCRGPRPRRTRTSRPSSPSRGCCRDTPAACPPEPNTVAAMCTDSRRCTCRGWRHTDPDGSRGNTCARCRRLRGLFPARQYGRFGNTAALTSPNGSSAVPNPFSGERLSEIGIGHPRDGVSFRELDGVGVGDRRRRLVAHVHIALVSCSGLVLARNWLSTNRPIRSCGAASLIPLPIVPRARWDRHTRSTFRLSVSVSGWGQETYHSSGVR